MTYFYSPSRELQTEPTTDHSFTGPLKIAETYATVNIEHQRSNAPLQSGSSTVVAISSFALLFLSITLYGYFTKIKDQSPSVLTREEQLKSVVTTAMTTTNQNGRPGHLTEEEEVKLREMWLLIGKLCGIIPTGKPKQESTEPTATPASPLTPTTPTLQVPTPENSATSKRSSTRLSWLRKMVVSDDEPEPPSQSNEIVDLMGLESSENDKHGLAQSFKDAMANFTPEDLRDAFWSMVKHDHPDGLLLRFLRARKWDVHAATVMAISALHWRVAEAKVDSDVMPLGELGMVNLSNDVNETEQRRVYGAHFMNQIRQGKSFIHGVDKEGRPCCYIRVRMHHPGEHSEESLERFTVYVIETARLLLSPPVDTATIVFDMTNFGLSNMDYHPVKFMIKCFEANYPECLGAILIHKAPWIFQGIWRIIRTWLDPVVANKVHFTNNITDLEEFIAADRIITELGGPEKWAWEYIEPVQSENDKMKPEHAAEKQTLVEERKGLTDQYEAVIKEWTAADEGILEAFRARRDVIAARLKDNYWRLDPYIRARSVYDRNGVLKGEGLTDVPLADLN